MATIHRRADATEARESVQRTHTPRFTRQYNLETGRFRRFGENSDLGRLAGALDTLERDEASATRAMQSQTQLICAKMACFKRRNRRPNKPARSTVVAATRGISAGTISGAVTFSTAMASPWLMGAGIGPL